MSDTLPAASDVFSPHLPLLPDPLCLLMFPNVLITSRQAFLGREVLSQIAHVTTGNILKLETHAPFPEGTTL